MSHEEDKSFLSRALTNILGKSTHRLDFTVPESIADIAVAIAMRTGRTKTTVMKEALVIQTAGKLALFRQMYGDHAGNKSVSLEEAISGFAAMEGMNRDDYIYSVLATHVWGYLHVLQSREKDAMQQPAQVPEH
jgi:hypothetical protein